MSVKLGLLFRRNIVAVSEITSLKSKAPRKIFGHKKTETSG